MPIFHYHARDRQGKIVTGEADASSEKIAADTLRDRGFEIIDLKIVKRRALRIPFLERISARDFVIFSRQLSVLIDADIPLVQSLKTVARQTVNKNFQKVLNQVVDEVEAGSKFSLALSRRPKIFDNFFINMIKSGETTGRLSDVLGYLADQKEKDYDLISKIRGAMMYPSFILIGMLGVVAVLLIFVVPQLTGVLLESGAELPLTTKILIGVSAFLKKYWLLILLFFVILIILFKYLLKNKSARIIWDNFKLRIPIIGTLFQKIYLVRFTRSLETLLVGGVDIVSSLKVASEVVGNAVYKKLIEETTKAVEDGNPIISVFEKSKLIPSMINQMLSVGEETGRLREILSRLTAFYSREIDNGVTNLVSIIEPIIIVVIGVGVGVIVSAIIMPMYKLAGQF